ncbi:MAG TPA: DUF1611 domain-containing protein [Chromatiales bacterium]|nr:DUF1611 domain-containing protein [Chromatiales bacterium]
MTTPTPLARGALDHAKSAYTARRVDLSQARALLGGEVRPRFGDVVLARVSALGHHTRLESPAGRRVHLFPGDEIVVVYGTRYAPDQFEALVPADLGSCHLVAAGGIAASMRVRHTRAKRPTAIEPLGILLDAGSRRLNLQDWRLTPVTNPRGIGLPTIAVAGTAMNSGKTTAAAHLVRGLATAGVRVGAAKLTGAGSGPDRWKLMDAGAQHVVDFTDAGYVSTYGVAAAELDTICCTLLAELERAGCEVAVLEVADGLFQEETVHMLQSPCFQRPLAGMLFAAGDAAGAVLGAQCLKSWGLPLLGLAGLLETSPLAVREAVAATGFPLFTSEELSDPKLASSLCEHAVAGATPKVAACAGLA